MVGNAGAVAVSEALKVNTTLTDLYLGCFISFTLKFLSFLKHLCQQLEITSLTLVCMHCAMLSKSTHH